MNLTIEEQQALLQNARQQFITSIDLKKRILEGQFLDVLVNMANTIAHALAKGGKLMLCGNGGSAADAQHLAAELLVRLRSQVNRQALPALSLAMDPSTMTACANDYGFEQIFERMVQALGRPEDILLGITTSGRSPNIVRALKAARQKGIITLGLLGGDGGEALTYCDASLIIPSRDPNRIQEAHITLGHILMDLIEGLMLERKQVETLKVVPTEAL